MLILPPSDVNMEVYNKTVTEFRAACYELTGFTIDRTDTLFKLQSVFAERKEDYLLFKVHIATYHADILILQH